MATPAQQEVEIGWKTVDASLLFDRYIAQPYWPERNLLINVAKQLHPKWNDAKKEQGINAALGKLGKTRDEYNRALIRANERSIRWTTRTRTKATVKSSSQRGSFCHS